MADVVVVSMSGQGSLREQLTIDHRDKETLIAFDVAADGTSCIVVASEAADGPSVWLVRRQAASGSIDERETDLAFTTIQALVGGGCLGITADAIVRIDDAGSTVTAFEHSGCAITRATILADSTLLVAGHTTTDATVATAGHHADIAPGLAFVALISDEEITVRTTGADPVSETAVVLDDIAVRDDGSTVQVGLTRWPFVLSDGGIVPVGGFVIAFDRFGEVEWHHSLGASIGLSVALALDGDRVFVGAHAIDDVTLAPGVVVPGSFVYSTPGFPQGTATVLELDRDGGLHRASWLFGAALADIAVGERVILALHARSAALPIGARTSSNAAHAPVFVDADALEGVTFGAGSP